MDAAFERGWSNLRNGALLDRAEADGYELLVTTDQNLCHQQNLADRQLALVVLHDKALLRVMTSLMKDDTELFKQFMDNTGFKQWMTNAVFELACKQADPPLHTANL